MLRSRPPRKIERALVGHIYRTTNDPAETNAFVRQRDPRVDHVLPATQRDVALKDNIATTSDLTTTCGSQMLRYHRSPFEAGVVKELKERLATVVGKTNLDEFGMGSHSTNSIFGPVKNIPPFDDMSVGGSSGGSAVAIVAERCGMALGTDTGGSVRLPAAYTGITGFKPSYGYISRWGVIPYANSLDTVGILGLSVKVVSHGFRCASHPDARDPTSHTASTRTRLQASLHESKIQERKQRMATGERNPRNEIGGIHLRIGVPMEYNIEELEPGVRDVWTKALELLQDNGATLVPISLPNTKHALSAYYVLAPAEAASNLSKYDGIRYGTRRDGPGHGHVLFSRTRGAGFGHEVKRRILLGSYTLSSEARDNYFLKAQKVRRLVQTDFDRVFAASNPLRPAQQFDLSDLDDSIPMQDKLGPAEVDFIVCPTAPTAAPRLSDVSKQTPVHTYMNDVFTVPASLAGLPAISIPFSIAPFFRKHSHPNYAGVQIIGQFANDSGVLDLASKLEASRDAHDLYESPVGKSFSMHSDTMRELRHLYAEKTGIQRRSTRRTTDGPLPFPPQKKLSWNEYGSDLTAEPSVRPTPTYGINHMKRRKTDKEINQGFEATLDKWDSIKHSEK